MPQLMCPGAAEVLLGLSIRGMLGIQPQHLPALRHNISTLGKEVLDHIIEGIRQGGEVREVQLLEELGGHRVLPF